MAKRITIFSGHYGSGKTNIAVNYAIELKAQHSKVTVCDIDIVNPYFRTKDSQKLLEEKGIELIVSDYANTNVDIPALPQQIYSVTDDKSKVFVLDVGGDERGALALGRISPEIQNENDYDMLLVVNFCRPLTNDINGVIEVKEEIENACKLKFTGIINNTNLGEETDIDVVKMGIEKVKELEKVLKIPYLYTTVYQSLDVSSLKEEKIKKIKLQSKI